MAAEPEQELRPPDHDKTVFAWRYQQLVKHGFNQEDALAVAASLVDLHVATALIKTCPSSICVRILL